MENETQSNPEDKSNEFAPGSKEWHFAMAEELAFRGKKEKDSHLLELSDFHRAIGENQPSARKK